MSGEKSEVQDQKLPDPGMDRYDEATRRALRLFVILARASASVAEHSRQDILGHNLSVSEFGVLELLWHKGPQPLGEIAARILLTTGSVTYVIDQLAKQDLVARRPCPSDRRIIFAELTAAGRERIEAIFPQHVRCLREAVSGLSPDEQEAATVLLKKLGLAAKAANQGPQFPNSTPGGFSRATKGQQVEGT